MSYALCADIHAHGWSAFSSVDEDGVNTRLTLLMQELEAAADNLWTTAGGTQIILAGDIFHVRGKVAPSVLNVVKDTLENLVTRGFEFTILAGNHDLEGKESTRIGSAVTALEGPNIRVINEREVCYIGGRKVALIPWIEDLEDLKVKIVASSGRANDLILHAPINGVIKGIPDTGLDPAWLEAQGFDNVFAGHYHNHKRLADHVTSIGALAHHTWSDVGSQAGHIIVGDSGLWQFTASACPRFVELDASMSDIDMKLEADGNYVRIRIPTTSGTEVEEFRKLLLDSGARGVQIIAEPASTAPTRAATGIKSGMTLDESVAKYIDPTGTDPEKVELIKLCQDILDTVRHDF